MTRPPGLARERTANARGRTALGAAGLAVLLLRLGVTRDRPFEVAAGALAALLAAALAGHAAATDRAPGRDRMAVVAVSAAVIAIGALTVVAALT